jgi:hypothetical protein
VVDGEAKALGLYSFWEAQIMMYLLFTPKICFLYDFKK